MSIAIDRPERLSVSFGGYSGKAGVDRSATPWRLSFVGKRSDYKGVENGTVGDTPVRVVDVQASKVVTGMVVLTVEPGQPLP